MRPGRPKGAKNKLTATVKENIIAVFTRLGGTAAMAEWASDNRTEFYRLYAKLAPTQVEIDVERRDVIELSDAELASIATSSSGGVTSEAAGKAEPASVH